MTKIEIPKLPELTVNKNGYQIRSDILHLAQNLVEREYAAKYAGWEVTAARDEKTNQIVTTVSMPEFPGLDKIIETAERMYLFVGQTYKKWLTINNFYENQWNYFRS